MDIRFEQFGQLLTRQNIYFMISLIAIIACLVMIYQYFKIKRQLDEMWAVDTYSAKDLRRMCTDNFKATVEIEGNVSCDQPAESPAMKFPCCYSKTIVERQIPVENGRSVNTAYQWQKTCEVIRTAVFKVNDSTGYTLVEPKGADIETELPESIITDTMEPWFIGTPKSYSGKYKLTETIFIPTGYAYVLGEAACRAHNGDVIMACPSHGYTDPSKRYFVISRKSEKSLCDSLNMNMTVCFWLGGVSFLVSAFALLAGCGMIR